MNVGNIRRRHGSPGRISKKVDLRAVAGKADRRRGQFSSERVVTFLSEVLTTGFYLPTGEVFLEHHGRRVPNGAKLG